MSSESYSESNNFNSLKLDGNIIPDEVCKRCLEQKLTPKSIENQKNSLQKNLILIFKNRSFEQKNQLTKAYEIAFIQHLCCSKKPENAFRKGGGLYITHPVEVAKLIEQNYPDLPIEVIIAALLHDVIEDTSETSSLRDFINTFNQPDSNPVLAMLHAVTNVEDEDGKTNEEETYGKLARMNSSHLHCVIIKAADRLHNMRTMHCLSIKTQKKMCRVNNTYLLPIFKHFGEEIFALEIKKLTENFETTLTLEDADNCVNKPELVINPLFIKA